MSFLDDNNLGYSDGGYGYDSVDVTVLEAAQQFITTADNQLEQTKQDEITNAQTEITRTETYLQRIPPLVSSLNRIAGNSLASSAIRRQAQNYLQQLNTLGNSLNAYRGEMQQLINRLS